MGRNHSETHDEIETKSIFRDKHLFFVVILEHFLLFVQKILWFFRFNLEYYDLIVFVFSAIEGENYDLVDVHFITPVNLLILTRFNDFVTQFSRSR